MNPASRFEMKCPDTTLNKKQQKQQNNNNNNNKMVTPKASRYIFNETHKEKKKTQTLLDWRTETFWSKGSNFFDSCDRLAEL